MSLLTAALRFIEAAYNLDVDKF